jgi:hypothetical protein
MRNPKQRGRVSARRAPICGRPSAKARTMRGLLEIAAINVLTQSE